MATFTITIPDEIDAKLRAQFPDPNALFQKVVADAVQDYDTIAAQTSIPTVTRIDETSIEVSVDRDVAPAPSPVIKAT